MRVFQSAVLRGITGIEHATAPLQAQPLTFSGHTQRTVVHARKRFLKNLHTELDNLILGHQVHSDRIRIVGEAERGAGGRTPKTYLAATDGLLTQRPDVALGIFTADCVPVLLADSITGWIGALHVGWRGAVKALVPKALSLLKEQGVDLRTVKVWLGPSICRKHYLVDPARAKQLSRAFHGQAVSKRKGGFAVDLRKGITGQLVRQGISRSNIEVSTICTYEEQHLPSARRDGQAHANTLTVIVRQAKLADLRGQRVVVYGLGVQGGGEAAVRYAVQQHAQVTVFDAKPASAFVAIRKRLRGLPVQYLFGQQSIRSVPGADVIIKNPGVPIDDPALRSAQRAGVIITSDLGLFRASSPNPIIAITGTKGKTTVATWLAALLRTKVRGTVLAGNVRHSPLLEPRAYDGRTPVVLELSSFQLEALDVPLAPKLALVTNLFPDHLDRHKTMRAYAAVKARVAEGQIATDYFIAPLDSEWSRFSNIRTRARTFWTSDKPQPKANAFIQKTWIVLRVQGKLLRVVPVSKLKQQDIGTVRCAISVALAGYLLGHSLTDIRRSLCKFPGVPERFEVVRTFSGRTFINNTTATNPASAVAGIASVPGRCIVIAGGTDKGLPKRQLVQALNRVAAVVFLPGTATKVIAPKVHVPSTFVRSMAAAVRAAVRYSKSSDTILLSPGAASFGLFRNEFDRGAQFVRAVLALQ
ncbi:MAG: UDP-N-acetylmuramoyl-L-alanine--D-glutamate ligase [bacterium]|nr:UDP-N-acetylmuramoyl-L-alanine--D-glutamate ligase [bacterium]